MEITNYFKISCFILVRVPKPTSRMLDSKEFIEFQRYNCLHLCVDLFITDFYFYLVFNLYLSMIVAGIQS